MERLAQDPASVEARESVAEWQRLRTNLLQAGPSGVRFPRRRRGESRRMQLFKDTLVALMVGGAGSRSIACERARPILNYVENFERVHPNLLDVLAPPQDERAGLSSQLMQIPPRSIMH